MIFFYAKKKSVMLKIEIKIMLAATILLGSNNLVSATGIGDIQTIVNFANDAWGVLNGELPFSALLTGSTGPMLDKIMAVVEQISEQVEELSDTVVENGRKIDDMTDLLERMLVKLPIQDKVDKSMRKLKSYMERVDFLYDNLQRLTASGKNFTRTTMLLFVESVISTDTGDLVDTLERMHRLFVPGRSASYKDSLFYLLSENVKDSDDTECGSGISSQMSIYEIYKSVEVSEIRAFVMTMASYSLLTVYENASFSGELVLTRNDFIERSRKYLSSAKFTLETVSRAIHLCDIGPFNYNYHKTYEKFPVSYNMRNPAGHTIYVAPMRSNYHENKVVTGVRFVEKNGVIFAQIKDAQLLPKGRVNASTEKWHELPDYESREDDDLDYKFFYKGTNELVKTSRIHTLTYNLRGFDLDEILLPPNRLLTGISFEMRDNDLSLDIMTTAFDYESGLLNLNSSEWGGWRQGINADIDGVRNYLDINGLKDPSKVNKPQKIDTFGKTWFKFQLENDDFDANIIPMLDARPVEGKPSVPLAGIALYHRGNHESGGIIHFKVFTIDITAYMKSDTEE